MGADTSLISLVHGACQQYHAVSGHQIASKCMHVVEDTLGEPGQLVASISNDDVDGPLSGAVLIIVDACIIVDWARALVDVICIKVAAQ